MAEKVLRVVRLVCERVVIFIIKVVVEIFDFIYYDLFGS